MVLDGSSPELSSEETSLELSGIVLETGFVFPLVFLLEVAEVEFGFLFPLVVGFPVVPAGGSDCVGGGVLPVSYTHLDVYKRQPIMNTAVSV